MSTEEATEAKKKTVSKSKAKLTAKKKSASPEQEIPKKKKSAPEPEAPRKKKSAPEPEAPRKKKSASEQEAPRKKKSASEPEAPKKKKSAPEPEAPKKKKSASEPETPKKKKSAPESGTIKKKKAPASENSAPKIKKVSSGSQVPEKKKTKVRLKRNAKIAFTALGVGLIFCGAFAFKNANRSSAETEENIIEAEVTETIPETTEEPTTEETTEEPTTENLNEPFIDYNYPVDPDKPMLALTYDDGPASSTSQILDILEENHAHATFFVVGKNVDEDSEEILRREVALGCEVANHSWDHESLRDCDLEDALESLRKCDEAIFNAIHRYPQHVRPPYGEYSDELLDADGREFVYWSLDTNDWKYRDAKKDYEVLMDNLDDGDIILMHDIHPESADASEKIIPDLIEMGYQLVTVSELMYYRDCPHKPGMLLFDVHPDAPYYIWQGEYYDEPVEQDASEEDSTEEDASGDTDSEDDDSTEETTETSSDDEVDDEDDE